MLSLKEQARIAFETVCPLPPNVSTKPRPPRLSITVVVLDKRLVTEAVVPPSILSDLGKVILRYLGRKPLPAAWVRHWRTGEVETPRPANAGESSHFNIWREVMFSNRFGFRPPGPIESLRPSMLPLLAARLVEQYNKLVRGSRYSKDLPVSFFFSNKESNSSSFVLGDQPGIIVELHDG